MNKKLFNLAKRFFSKTVYLATLGFATLSFGEAARAEYILYDGTLGTQMSSQNWTFIGPGVTPTWNANAQQLNTTALNAFQAGFTPNSLPISLNQSNGYDVLLNLKINSESHASTDRAGFSLIALGSDNKGIELGFWNDRIFAQNSGFTHGEERLFDTTLATDYQIHIQGGNYTLSAAGMTDLTGSLRDYSSFGGPPYTLSNFIFLGDDTSSAQASVSIGHVGIIPEPATLAFAALAAAGICAVGYRKIKGQRLGK